MEKRKSLCVTLILAMTVLFAVFVLSDYASPKGNLKDSGQIQRRTRQTARPTVSSVYPNDLKLVKGGSSQTVTIKGSNLNLAASIQVLYRGNITQEVTATLLQPGSDTEKKVEFKASANAVIGSEYLIRLIAGRQSFDLSVQVLRLEVVGPERRFAERADKRIPAAKSVQTLSPYVPGPRKPGPMRWSPVSQRGPDPERPKNPPIITSAQMGKQVQFRNDLIQYNKRPGLAFIPFKMVDPATGTPIDPNTLITLPDGVSLAARDYYNELNFFEENLNKAGYSLDPERDPADEINLGGIPTQLGRTSAKIRWDDSVERIAKTTRENINIRIKKTRDLLSSATASAVAVKKTTVATKELPVAAKLKVTQAQQPVSANVTPYDNILNPEVFSAGNDVFGAGTTAWAALKANTESMSINNIVTVTGSIAGNAFEIAKFDSLTESPISGGASSATCTRYLFGQASSIHNQQNPVPAGPLTQMSGGVPYSEFDVPYKEPYTPPPYSWTIIVLDFIPIVITAGTSVEIGVDFKGGIGPAALQNSINPYVTADIYASAAVDYWLAAAGAEVNLTLINAQTAIVCGLTRAFENASESSSSLRSQAATKTGASSRPASHSIWPDYWIYSYYGALSGSFGVFLQFRYPCLKKGICKKKYPFELFSWPGIYNSSELATSANVPSYTLAEYPDGKIPGYNK
jgi:hypothetical protein